MTVEMTADDDRPAPATGGFAAQFQGASLWDLIQFECLRRSRRAVRIRSRGLVGLVYFRDGNVVHATTVRHAGEAAVREMLDWQEGTCEAWDGPWPERETITTAWQSLLLRAAQAKDEASSPEVLNVLAFPARDAGPKGEEAVSSSSLPAAAAAPTLATVVLGPDGSVLRGQAVPGLPQAASYAVQMGDLIGAFLDLDGFRGLEVAFEDLNYMVGRAVDGRLVAARAARPSELEALRKELGL